MDEAVMSGREGGDLLLLYFFHVAKGFVAFFFS